MRTTKGKELPIPSDAFSRGRQQFLTTHFLRALADKNARDDEIHLGHCLLKGRLSSQPRGWTLSARLRARARIEAVHELGHVFGVAHCARRDCVMWFSNTLSETDRKGASFCPEHARQLEEAKGRMGVP
ncbi:hypothetical protein KFL_000080010 [Klebsormidium nitens]|uniref:Uncharacterized protein n=1 Tax=Klebsormidium nitens TaxID=105231 RepID=A0A1Y1HNG8_KLENI|nr:hypothetical protein KFL_000080010 [Klebsormidium nitens]|eukprot:GAQ78097.1 hypothetical protein KFL_000080010 [Klebsormidium nitens]